MPAKRPALLYSSGRTLPIGIIRDIRRGKFSKVVALVHPGSHQGPNKTSFNRYPEIFAAAVAALPNAQKILSFGCSTGPLRPSSRSEFRLWYLKPTMQRLGSKALPEGPDRAGEPCSTSCGKFVIGNKGTPSMQSLALSIALLLAMLASISSANAGENIPNTTNLAIQKNYLH